MSFGIRILSRSAEEPLRQIVENAGEDPVVVLTKVKRGKGEYSDIIDAGIVDPATVTHPAIRGGFMGGMDISRSHKTSLVQTLNV